MKVGYSKTYPLTQYWEKNWLEDDIPTGLTIDSTDKEIEAVMKKVRRMQYALKKQVESFHYEALAAMEKQMGTHVVTKSEEIFNQEWEDIKTKLLSFDDAEVAQKYLDSTSYNMTIEAKQIINSLKNKK